jgi:hypothetical protein
MDKRISVLAAAAWMSVLPGCQRPPAPPVPVAVDSLRFPVVVITGTHPSHIIPARADVATDREALGRMRTETYARINDATVSDPPIVIDAAAATFDMTEIKGQRGGLWMMINPTSRMPIAFTLFRRKESGIAAARKLVAASTYLGRDFDAERAALRRQRIGQAQTMAQIVAIIDALPPGT